MDSFLNPLYNVRIRKNVCIKYLRFLYYLKKIKFRKEWNRYYSCVFQMSDGYMSINELVYKKLGTSLNININNIKNINNNNETIFNSFINYLLRKPLKIASFDFDGTLINKDFCNNHMNNIIFDKEKIPILDSLKKKKYEIVVFSNQTCVSSCVQNYENLCSHKLPNFFLKIKNFKNSLNYFYKHFIITTQNEHDKKEKKINKINNNNNDNNNNNNNDNYNNNNDNYNNNNDNYNNNNDNYNNNNYNNYNNNNNNNQIIYYNVEDIIVKKIKNNMYDNTNQRETGFNIALYYCFLKLLNKKLQCTYNNIYLFNKYNIDMITTKNLLITLKRNHLFYKKLKNRIVKLKNKNRYKPFCLYYNKNNKKYIYYKYLKKYYILKYLDFQKNIFDSYIKKRNSYILNYINYFFSFGKCGIGDIDIFTKPSKGQFYLYICLEAIKYLVILNCYFNKYLELLKKKKRLIMDNKNLYTLLSLNKDIFSLDEVCELMDMVIYKKYKKNKQDTYLDNINQHPFNVNKLCLQILDIYINSLLQKEKINLRFVNSLKLEESKQLLFFINFFLNDQEQNNWKNYSFNSKMENLINEQEEEEEEEEKEKEDIFLKLLNNSDHFLTYIIINLMYKNKIIKNVAKKISSLFINIQDSFYVGDNIGRPFDKSDIDKKYANNIGIRIFGDDYFRNYYE
ncbi:phosphatase, putative [Plasmodium sp. gorilla clade G3]|nr:phosphatase, putative [Plasmodium sp. gorilla clade G3]